MKGYVLETVRGKNFGVLIADDVDKAIDILGGKKLAQGGINDDAAVAIPLRERLNSPLLLLRSYEGDSDVFCLVKVQVIIQTSID